MDGPEVRLLWRAAMAVTRAPDFEAEGMGKSAAVHPDEQSSAEEEDGVNTDQVVMRVVNAFLHAQPDREFVESERGADTVKERHRAAGEKRTAAPAGTDFDQPAESDGQKKNDSEDEMVNVRPMKIDVMEWAFRVNCGVGNHTRRRKRDEETNRREQESLAGTIADVKVKEFIDLGEIEEQEDHDNGRQNRECE